MNVIHFSITDVAGSPIELVKALNAYTDVKARFVKLKTDSLNKRVFEEDLVFEKDKEQVLELLGRADIIHLHQAIHPVENNFGINFDKLRRQGKKIIYQFHSVPHLLSKFFNIKIPEILNLPYPQLVIAQYPERYYPRAMVVPQTIPVNNTLYIPGEKTGDVSVSYFPSRPCTAWISDEYSKSWDTKGYCETMHVLNSLKERGIKVLSGYTLPHSQCLALKRVSHIHIDEVITGSFHRNSLEALSQGVTTIAFLDERVVNITKKLTGSNDLPWINTGIFNLEKTLRELINEPEKLKTTGINSRAWMEKYYGDELMVRHFTRIYRDLSENEALFLNVNRINENHKKLFLKLENDWKARRKKYLSELTPEILGNFFNKNRGKNIYFYGYGEYMRKLSEEVGLNYPNFKGFIDKNAEKTNDCKYPLFSPGQIRDLPADIIVPTVLVKEGVMLFLEKIKKEENLDFEIVDYIL